MKLQRDHEWAPMPIGDTLAGGAIHAFLAILFLGATVLIARPALSKDASEDLATMSLDEISRKLENPLTKTVRIGKMPLKLRFEPQYSIVHPDDFGTVWNFRVQITPVIPNPFRRSDQ
jgi:hypothetical protein